VKNPCDNGTIRPVLIATGLLLIATAALSMIECTKKNQPPYNPMKTLGAADIGAPMVLFSAGDTTWVAVQSSSSSCPGDPAMGHGGEATGGPGPTQTMCFEGGPGDSCGTVAPWNTKCFDHIDVRTLPSELNINYWHVDTYRADQQAYCGSYALWCGSGALWQGRPVECGSWTNPPGYGDDWNCYVQLSLPADFAVAAGCTLYFDPRYDTECKYDYFYVDYWNGTSWVTAAAFNATSNNAGSPCLGTTNPDYFGNTDVNRLTNCNWQARPNPNEPALKKVIAPGSLIITSGPKFRWRVTSDGAGSDADGRLDTDGAAFIDNVWVCGDSSRFVEDFETGSLDSAYWSLPKPAGILDAWHIVHDPDPPYEGGDGGTRSTCQLDSSFMYRARPEQGYPAGVAWRNGWYYRLMTPRIPLEDTGCIIQYDWFGCSQDYTCDYGMTKMRYHDGVNDQWCPWGGWEGSPPCGGGCFFWSFNSWQNIWDWIEPTSNADSVQFAWEVVDVSRPGDTCRGKHKDTEFIVDNVSVGFYDYNATVFSARGVDLLHDTFFTGIAGYNSFFDVYSPDTVAKYSGTGAPPLPKDCRLWVDAIDRDHMKSVKLWGSITGGASWVSRAMTWNESYWPDPADGGEYYGTLAPSDFGLTQWAAGTHVWYYVAATDSLDRVAYWPPRADPAHPGHDGTERSYLEFTILPAFPEACEGPRILLVDGNHNRHYDWAPCLSVVDRQVKLEEIYEQTLTDAGYCYDKYDIEGSGSNVQAQPTDYSDYDAVVWFTGPYFSNYLIETEAQHAIRDYLADGGKVVLCGDRIAYNMEEVGEDSLGGEFLGGIMGSTYLEEMPSALTYPFVYAVPVESVLVFGNPVQIELDTVLVYRECPYFKDMTYVLANASPPLGYTAQRLMAAANPTIAQADEAIYVEYQGVGQCVYVNFDLSASVNHSLVYCNGDAATPARDFAAGTYWGRVELVRVILEDIFGLPSEGGIAGGPSPGPTTYQWALAQNAPNPSAASTEIRFEVARQGRVKVKVYSATGQLVRVLLDEAKEPGRYGISWNGRDHAGREVASGVYFYSFEGQGYRATKKMLVVK
jgi:hypothetical protein